MSSLPTHSARRLKPRPSTASGSPEELARAQGPAALNDNNSGQAECTQATQPDAPFPNLSHIDAQYRPEIDGLRAIAVLAVVLFHADIAIPGGFIGVDIFFVISGYLITKIIKREADRGTFSVARFYERRVRRIVPVLLVVLSLTLLCGYYWLLPSQYAAAARSAVATELFASNIYFFRHAGYFVESGGVTPLLHTWSLAVEEQFYLVFPVIITALLNRKGLIARYGLAVLLLASLAVSSISVIFYPVGTFYLFPTRAWELLAGAVLALGLVPPIKARLWRDLLSVAGLLFILAPFMVYSQSTIFPGLAAVPPVLGTALIIHATSGGRSTLGYILSARPIVFVGLISYSLYMFHWPVLTFLRQYTSENVLSGSSALFGVLVSLLLATISLFFVEAPFRDPRRISKRAVYLSCGIVTCLLGAVSVAIHYGSGLPSRFKTSTVALAAGAEDFSPKGKGCTNLDLTAALRSGDCHLGPPGPPSFVVIGDSHSAAMLPAFDVVGERGKVSGVLVQRNACPPFLGVAPLWGNSKLDRENCHARNVAAMTYAAQTENVKTVILVAAWEGYSDKGEAFVGTRNAIGFLTSRGKKVIVLMGFPTFDKDVPNTLAFQNERESALFVNESKSSANSSFRSFLTGFGADVNARIVDLRPLFCDRSGCRTSLGGRSLFRDDSHVSSYASENLIGPFLEREIGSALVGSKPHERQRTSAERD